MTTSYQVVWPSGNAYWYNHEHTYHRYYGPATPESWFLHGTFLKGSKTSKTVTWTI